NRRKPSADASSSWVIARRVPTIHADQMSTAPIAEMRPTKREVFADLISWVEGRCERNMTCLLSGCWRQNVTKGQSMSLQRSTLSMYNIGIVCPLSLH